MITIRLPSRRRSRNRKSGRKNSENSRLKPTVELYTEELKQHHRANLESVKDELSEATILREQVKFVVETLKTPELGVSASWQEIGKAFRLSKGAVYDLYQKGRYAVYS